MLDASKNKSLLHVQLLLQSSRPRPPHPGAQASWSAHPRGETKAAARGFKGTAPRGPRLSPPRGGHVTERPPQPPDRAQRAPLGCADAGECRVLPGGPSRRPRQERGKGPPLDPGWGRGGRKCALSRNKEAVATALYPVKDSLIPPNKLPAVAQLQARRGVFARLFFPPPPSAPASG